MAMAASGTQQHGGTPHTGLSRPARHNDGLFLACQDETYCNGTSTRARKGARGGDHDRVLEYNGNTAVLLCGDVLDCLSELPDESVQCCVTSPPYWGLRDYGTAQWEGGDPACDHRQGRPGSGRADGVVDERMQRNRDGVGSMGGDCQRCGAVRIDSQIGLEPTPDAYVAKLVAVFREVRRVLTKDGILWLNLGSSYCNHVIESQDYVILRNLPNERRRQIAQALSSVWSGHESAECALSRLLVQETSQAKKLYDENLPDLPCRIHKTQGTDGKILFSPMREEGKPDQEENFSNNPVPNMRKKFQQAQIGNPQESKDESLLQPDMLVQFQSAGQSLSVDGRAERANESARDSLAQDRASSGQTSLPDLSCQSEIGGASYSSIRDTQAAAMDRQQWDNTLSRLPREDETQRGDDCTDVEIHSLGSLNNLGNLIFPKSEIPLPLLQYCEPCWILKPKDEIGIPWRVAFALQADGWWLRSDIIWAKKNPMPELVRDRCTRSHEYVFMFSKQPKYYYNAEAIREPPSAALLKQVRDGYNGSSTKDFAANGAQDASATKSRIIEGARKRLDKQRGHSRRHAGFNDRWDAMTKEEQCCLGANKRDVWWISPQPTKIAHFATFPQELVRLCLLAGSRENDTILDPFTGSSTTGLVSLKHFRNFIGIDLNPDYIAMSLERLHSLKSD